MTQCGNDHTQARFFAFFFTIDLGGSSDIEGLFLALLLERVRYLNLLAVEQHLKFSLSCHVERERLRIVVNGWSGRLTQCRNNHTQVRFFAFHFTIDLGGSGDIEGLFPHLLREGAGHFYLPVVKIDLNRPFARRIERKTFRIETDGWCSSLFKGRHHYHHSHFLASYRSISLGGSSDMVGHLTHLRLEFAGHLNRSTIEEYHNCSFTHHIKHQGLRIKVNDWWRCLVGSRRIQELLDLLYILRSLLAVGLDEPKHQATHQRTHFGRHGQGLMLVGAGIVIDVTRHGRMLECEQVVKHGTQGIKVSPRAKFIITPLHLLTGRIAVGIGHGRSRDGSSRVRIELLAGTEVDEFDDARLIHHHIGRLEVHVPQSLAMHLLERIKHLVEHFTDF